METNKEIHDRLEEIRASEGGGFYCDEAAVETEFARHEALFSGIWVKILSVFGGFTAGVSLMGFLFLAEIINSEESMLVAGVIFTAASLAASVYVKNIVLDAAIISLYVIGCVLSAIGSGSPEAACWLLLVIAAITAVVTDNYILVFIAVLLFCGSIAGFFFTYEVERFFLPYVGVLSLALTGICSAEAQLVTSSPKINRRCKPAIAGMFVSLIAGFAAILLLPWYDNTLPCIGFMSLCLWGNILFILRKAVRTFGPTSLKIKIVFYSVSLFVLLPVFFAPAISGAVFLVLLAFRFNYKAAFAMSLLLLIWSIGQYYYDLNITLLVKSGILFFSGLLFLGFWLLFHKTIKNNDTI